MKSEDDGADGTNDCSAMNTSPAVTCFDTKQKQRNADGSFGWCPRSFVLDALARTLTADSNGSSNSRPRTYSLARASEARPWRGANGSLIHTNAAAECGSSGGLDIAWVSGQVWSLMLLDESDASAEVIAERINAAIRFEDAPSAAASPRKQLPAALITESASTSSATRTLVPSFSAIASTTELASSTTDSGSALVRTPPRRVQHTQVAARSAEETDALPALPPPPPPSDLAPVSALTFQLAATSEKMDEASPVSNAWFVSPASPESEMKHRPSRNTPTPTPPPVKPSSSPALSPAPVIAIPAVMQNTNSDQEDSRIDDYPKLKDDRLNSRPSVSVSSSSRADVIHDSSDDSSSASTSSPRSQSSFEDLGRGSHGDAKEEHSYSEDDTAELHGLACQSQPVMDAIAEAAAMAAAAASDAAQASLQKALLPLLPPLLPQPPFNIANTALDTGKLVCGNEEQLTSAQLAAPSCDASLAPSPSNLSPDKPQPPTAVAAAPPSPSPKKGASNFSGQIAPIAPGKALGSPFRPLSVRRDHATANNNSGTAHSTTATLNSTKSDGDALRSPPFQLRATLQEEHNRHTSCSEHGYTQRATAPVAAGNVHETKIRASWEASGRLSSAAEYTSGVTTEAASTATSSNSSNSSFHVNSGNERHKDSNFKGSVQVPLHSSKLILERFGLLDQCQESTAADRQPKYPPESMHVNSASAHNVNDSVGATERSSSYVASCGGNSGPRRSFKTTFSGVEGRRRSDAASVARSDTSSIDPGYHRWSSQWSQSAQSHRERDEEKVDDEQDSFVGEAWASEGLTAEQALLKRFHSAFEWMASTLETAEVAHAAALDDAVSRERTNAAQAHAVQAATIAQQVKKQARELAEKEVESRVAEAVESVEGMAAEEVAALRDQHAKDQACIAQDLAELQRLHGEKCKRYEASIFDLNHQLQYALRAQAECEVKCQAETQATAQQVRTYYERMQLAEARATELESEFNARRNEMETALNSQREEMENAVHAQVSRMESEFNARVVEIENEANERVVETENNMRAQQRAQADDGRNRHLAELAALRESHAHEVEVAVAAAVGAVSDAAADRAQAAAAGATQREAAAMAGASAHVRRLEAENAELRRQLHLARQHNLTPSMLVSESSRQQGTFAAPPQLTRGQPSPPRKEYSRSVPNTPSGYERSSTAAIGTQVLPQRSISSGRPPSSSTQYNSNKAVDTFAKGRASTSGAALAQEATSRVTTNLSSGQQDPSARSALNTPQRRTSSSFAVTRCSTSTESSSSAKRVPLNNLVNRQTSQGIGQQVDQQINTDSKQHHRGSLSREGLPPRPPPIKPHPSPLPPKYQEEYQDEYAWAQQQAQSQPHLLDLPPQTTRGAAEDIIYAGDDRYVPREASACKVRHDGGSGSEMDGVAGEKSGSRSRSHAKVRRGTVAGKSTKARTKSKAAGKVTGKAAHHRQRQSSQFVASEGGALAGPQKTRPMETAMRRRRQEALHVQQREVL